MAGKLSNVNYRPAAAAFLLMISMALTTTALSFFVEPVCDALGIGRGTFTVYYSIMTASGTLAIPVLGQSIGKRGPGSYGGQLGLGFGGISGIFPFRHGLDVLYRRRMHGHVRHGMR